MSKSLNCACCGRTFNHNRFPYRPSVISALEYACSIRCKSDMESYYSPKKKTKQESEDSPSSIGTNLLVEVIIGFGILAAVVAAGM